MRGTALLTRAVRRAGEGRRSPELGGVRKTLAPFVVDERASPLADAAACSARLSRAVYARAACYAPTLNLVSLGPSGSGESEAYLIAAVSVCGVIPSTGSWAGGSVIPGLRGEVYR